MKNKKPIVYLEHPVSAEEKAKHIKAGKRIMDAKFQPAQEKKAPKKAAKPEPKKED